MTLPCSNATDARSLEKAKIGEGQEVEAVGRIANTAGNTWYQVNINGENCYLYSGDVKKVNWFTRLLDWLL